MKPDLRIIELCDRLMQPGPITNNLSASELHEIANFIYALNEPSPSEALSEDDPWALLRVAQSQRDTAEKQVAVLVGKATELRAACLEAIRCCQQEPARDEYEAMYRQLRAAVRD